MKWIGQHIFDYISRFRNDIHVDGKILDSDGSPGSSGDILTSTGTTVEWSDAAVTYNTVATYTHTQNPAATSWVIEHNLNKHPSVTVVTGVGVVIIADVTYDSADQLTITLLQADTGKAYLN